MLGRYVSRATAWSIAILLVHLSLIPVAIAGTRLAYGFEDALTIHNQNSWTPIVMAQSCLLAMFVGLGPGTTTRRLLVLVLGSLLLTIFMVYAYTWLQTFPDPFWPTFLGQLQTQSLLVMLPLSLEAVILLQLRPFTSGAWGDRRVSVKDILLITAFAAVATAWFSYVAKQSIGGGQFIYDIISIRGLSKYAIFNCAGILSVYWMVFGERHRWLGTVTLLFYAMWLGFQPSTRPWAPWFHFAYSWSIVIATVYAYRMLVVGSKSNSATS